MITRRNFLKTSWIFAGGIILNACSNGNITYNKFKPDVSTKEKKLEYGDHCDLYCFCFKHIQPEGDPAYKEEPLEREGEFIQLLKDIGFDLDWYKENFPNMYKIECSEYGSYSISTHTIPKFYYIQCFLHDDVYAVVKEKWQHYIDEGILVIKPRLECNWDEVKSELGIS